jgi:putative secretion ATPase (PEP-CTERM system associated)
MYDDFYGLTDKPFQLTPDPRFYFESATHRKAMAYLGYGLAQGEGFIVITGEIGAGKTTLVGHLMSTIDPSRVSAINIVSTQVEGDDMLRLVASGLKIDTTGADKALLLSKIDMLLQDRVKTGQRTLLIVDEAQNLPTSALEELRMLSNFQSGASAMMQILLLGQPEFRERLNSAVDLEQLRQRVIATHHLTSMESEEIGPYLAHRLKLVGWNGRPQFTEGSIEVMEKYSGGLPRKINTLAGRVLLLGAVEQCEVIDTDVVYTVIADLERDTGAPKMFAEAAEPIAVSEPLAAVAPATEVETPPQSEEHPMYHQPVASPVEPPFAPQPSAPLYAREPEPMVHDFGDEPEAVLPISRPFLDAPVNVAVAPAAVEMPPPAPVAAPVTPVADAQTLDLQARVAMLEAQVEEQDAALRRVLALLVEWVENDGGIHSASAMQQPLHSAYSPAA